MTLTYNINDKFNTVILYKDTQLLTFQKETNIETITNIKDLKPHLDCFTEMLLFYNILLSWGKYMKFNDRRILYH